MPAISVVVLTWNEGDNIQGTLDALARQSFTDFEVIVVDAASDDDTVPIVLRQQHAYPVPLHLEACDTKIPIGEARNIGVELARAPHIAFLSADAEPDVDWLAHVNDRLAEHDMVFGRQVHAPHRWTSGASVRGLRYHFPDRDDPDALRYASNVCAAYRKPVLQAFPFDPAAIASEDVLLAHRASAAGLTACYEPRMVVYHHDVTSARQEMRKNLREGYADGRQSPEVGAANLVLAWGATLAGCIALLPVRPKLMGLSIALVAWAPSLRRAFRHRNDMPLRPLLTGLATSPAYDLAFLIQYLRGIREARP